MTAVNIPAGIDDVKMRNQLLDEFNIEIAGGIGGTKGKIWRLGLMGFCSQKQFVLQLLAALEKVLTTRGTACAGQRRWSGRRRVHASGSASRRRAIERDFYTNVPGRGESATEQFFAFDLFGSCPPLVH